VIRSDSGDAHRLSLSARVLSTMVSQVKAKPIAAEALLTSMKTTSETRIWPLHIATATGPRAVIFAVGESSLLRESVNATMCANLMSKVAVADNFSLSLANYTRVLLASDSCTVNSARPA
jgi:hypothetical protein